MMKTKTLLPALAVALMLLLTGAGIEMSAAPMLLSFGSGNTVGDPSEPVQALVAGDLDNDGDADLVIKNVDRWLVEFKDAPEAPVAIFLQGTIRFKAGKYEEARGYFERVLKEYSKTAKAMEAEQAIQAIDGRLKLKAEIEAKKSAPPPPAPAATATTGAGGK